MTELASDPAAQEAFRQLSAGGLVLEPCQTPAYVTMAARHAGWEAIEIPSPVEGSVASLAVRRVGPFSQVVLPPFAPYSAIVLQAESGRASDATRSLEALALDLESRFDDLVIHLPPGHPFTPVLTGRSWDVSTRRTYLLDTRTAAEVETWSASAGRNFRRHAEDFEVREEPGQAESVALLCRASYERSRRAPPIRPDSMAPLARAVVEAGLGQAWTARDAEGRVQAGLVTLTAGPTSSYWMAGSEPGPAMTVLLGRVLSELRDRGIPRFDFVGANTPSIAEFKRRFGGQLVEYAAARRTPNRLLAMARSWRDRAMRSRATR